MANKTPSSIPDHWYYLFKSYCLSVLHA